MNTKAKALFLCFALCLLTLLFVMPSCFSKREEILQKEDTCHFQFTGNLDEALVSVTRNGQPVWTDMEVDEDERYTIKPGTYKVQVTRNNELIVNKIVFLAGGNTREIHIP